MMELIVHVNNKKNIEKLYQKGVKKIVVGATTFSCRQAISLTYDEIAQIVESLPTDLEVYVLVNALIEEKYLSDLKEHLERLHTCNIHGLFFQDFGVLQICKEAKYAFAMMYAPDTLNTNAATLSYLQKQGITGAFLAREIPLVEKLLIQATVNLPCITQIHGVEYMAYSKRKLLQTYQEATNIHLKSKNITIQANQVKDSCHIYEDAYGTHIVSKTQLSCLDVLDQITDLQYGYIDSLYCKEEALIEIVDMYMQGLQAVKEGTYDASKEALVTRLQQLQPEQQYYHSFLFDQTVYKIEDVRKREEDEKNK